MGERSGWTKVRLYGSDCWSYFRIFGFSDFSGFRPDFGPMSSGIVLGIRAVFPNARARVMDLHYKVIFVIWWSNWWAVILVRFRIWVFF